MVPAEAVAIRKLGTARYSEQELSWCYKGTVTGLARMILMQGRGEQHELKRKKKTKANHYLTCYNLVFFSFRFANG